MAFQSWSSFPKEKRSWPKRRNGRRGIQSCHKSILRWKKIRSGICSIYFFSDDFQSMSTFSHHTTIVVEASAVESSISDPFLLQIWFLNNKLQTFQEGCMQLKTYSHINYLCIFGRRDGGRNFWSLLLLKSFYSIKKGRKKSWKPFWIVNWKGHIGL